MECRCNTCGEMIDLEFLVGSEEDGYKCYSCISDATWVEVCSEMDIE